MSFSKAFLAVSSVALISGCTSGHAASGPSHTAPRKVTTIGKTSCSDVFYVGDSISVGLVSPLQLPKSGDRLQTQLRKVGATFAHIDVSGGRATFERFEKRPNTLDVLTPATIKKFKGCYIMAVGTNDAGNLAAGASDSPRTRIDAIMSRIGNHPVLWPTLATNITGQSPYAEAHMKAFNAALVAATKRYPNLRVYDWAAEHNSKLTEPDGIHDRRLGSRERAVMYARALAVAFPLGGTPNSSAVVGSMVGKNPSPQNAPHLLAEPGDDEAFWAADSHALVHYTSGL